MAVALVAVLAMIGVMIIPNPIMRAAVGLPLIFYLPGHAILRAASRGPRNDLAAVVFAAGLSVVVTICCGLVVNLIGPLTPVRWTIALGTVTLAACWVACATDSALVAQPAPVTLPRLWPRQAAMLACSAAIVLACAVWARHEVLAHPEFAYTELWVTPVTGSGAVTIGVRNAERAPSSYDLEVTLDDRIVTARRSIELRVGESWVSDFALPMRDGEAHTAEARLFKDGNDRLVYRRAWLRTGSRDPLP